MPAADPVDDQIQQLLELQARAYQIHALLECLAAALPAAKIGERNFQGAAEAISDQLEQLAIDMDPFPIVGGYSRKAKEAA
jgi:hypothetical protein